MEKFIILVLLLVVGLGASLLVYSSKNKKGAIALVLFGVLLAGTPIVSLLGLIPSSEKNTVAVLPASVEEKIQNPTELGSSDSVAMPAEMDEVITPVAKPGDNPTLAKLVQNGLIADGSSLPQFLWNNGMIQDLGYLSVDEFIEAVKIQAAVETKVNNDSNTDNNVSFISPIAFGYGAEEEVDVQSLVDGALAEGMSVEDAVGFVSKPQGGDTLVNAGGLNTSKAKDEISSIITYPVKLNGKVINYNFNFFPKVAIEKLAKEAGIETGKTSLVSGVISPIKQLAFGTVAYAAENDGWSDWTWSEEKITVSQIPGELADKYGNYKVIVESEREGVREREYEVQVPKETYETYSTPKTVTKITNPVMNNRAKTVLVPCYNPITGLVSGSEWQTTYESYISGSTTTESVSGGETTTRKVTVVESETKKETQTTKESKTYESTVSGTVDTSKSSGMPSGEPVSSDNLETSKSETNDSANPQTPESTESPDSSSGNLAPGGSENDYSSDLEDAKTNGTENSGVNNSGSSANPYTSDSDTETAPAAVVSEKDIQYVEKIEESSTTATSSSEEPVNTEEIQPSAEITESPEITAPTTEAEVEPEVTDDTDETVIAEEPPTEVGDVVNSAAGMITIFSAGLLQTAAGAITLLKKS